MALSHIGRVLRQRLDEERLKMAFGLLDGAATDTEKLNWYVGYAQGLKWVIDMIEEIEREAG